MKGLFLLFLSHSLLLSVCGFVVPTSERGLTTTFTTSKQKITSSPSLVSMNAEKKRKSGLDPEVRDKLLAESIAPWRTLRKFLYVAAGSGALLGGLITLTGAIAAFAGARPDLDLNTEALNLGIDFGFVALFAVAWKIDSDKGAELDDSVKQKVERKKEQKKTARRMREREMKLQELFLNVQTSVDGSRTEGQIKILQARAKQNMIVIIGPKEACKQALIGANINSAQFGMSNILVVPYNTDIPEDQQASTVKEVKAGFAADRQTSETQPYVARPTGEGWERYIQAEMEDAVKQSGEQCKEDGIVIVVEKSGKVMRRGVGKVPWRDIIDELNGVEDEELATFGIPK